MNDIKLREAVMNDWLSKGSIAEIFTFTIKIFGDSMKPLYNPGDIVVLKKVENLNFLQFGEVHLIICDSQLNSMRILKIVRKHENENLIILKSTNPNFDDLVIPKCNILNLYIVQRKVCRTTF